MSPKEFVQDVKDRAFVRQKGVCAQCGDVVGVDSGYSHLKKPAELGGDTSLHNCVILCQKCHLQGPKYVRPPLPVQKIHEDF